MTQAQPGRLTKRELSQWGLASIVQEINFRDSLLSCLLFAGLTEREREKETDIYIYNILYIYTHLYMHTNGKSFLPTPLSGGHSPSSRHPLSGGHTGALYKVPFASPLLQNGLMIM